MDGQLGRCPSDYCKDLKRTDSNNGFSSKVNKYMLLLFTLNILRIAEKGRLGPVKMEKRN